MKVFGYELCAPAYVYFAVAVIVTLVIFLLNASVSNILPLLSQLFFIAICALILTFICSLGEEGKVGTTISWVITGLFLCMTCLGVLGAVTGTGGISTPMGTIGNPESI